jgi:hypothetical protein
MTNTLSNNDKIDLFYRINYVNPLKVELYKDFILSLIDVIQATYPGDDIQLENYHKDHFKFCFNKVVNNFKQEELYFNGDDMHIFNYFYSTIETTFYLQKDKIKSISSLKKLYTRIFDMEDMNKTQSDLDLFIVIYKNFNKLFKPQGNEVASNTNK